jgi:hypothetical protein
MLRRIRDRSVNPSKENPMRVKGTKIAKGAVKNNDGAELAAAAEKTEPVAVKPAASAKPLGRIYTETNPGTRARLFVDTERGKGTRIELTGKRRGQWFVYVPADKDAAARVQQWLNAERRQTGNKVE